jgi:C4-dicarboxylate-specific signal transduction histidine kinase
MNKARIMIVEDVWLIANDIKNSLESFGYAVTSIASSGEEALENAEEDKPDLILMDIVLTSEMDGIKAAAKIRSQCAVPIIYLTAYSDDEKLQRAKVTEPFGYILKPFSERELYCNIEIALFKHKIEEELRLAKEALQQANELLEQRVAERTAELSETIEMLKNETSESLRLRAELCEKELMLLQQSRLAAMGEMIGNIAHQWRQPLNMLGLLAQELLMTYKKGEFGTEYLDANVKKTLETIRYMSKTIDDFRFYLKPVKEKVDFRVLETIEKITSLLDEEGSLNEQPIRTSVVSACDPVVNGYPNELSQVLLNILVNARDAFAIKQVASPIITIKVFTEGGRCVVTITDNAGGIPEDIIDKIFDPYFTTKGPDKGSGVGLYMAKIIIEKNMNGTLSARNVVDGAEFRIEV